MNAQDLELVSAIIGLGAPPMGGGGHPHGGFHHTVSHGGRFRRFRGGGPWFDWPWFWGPNVYVEPASCSWMPPAGPVPSDVVATLSKLPFQAGWRAAFVGGGWWGERASPHAYFVCVVAASFITGLYGVAGLGDIESFRPSSAGAPGGIYPYYMPSSERMGPVWPVGSPEHGASQMGPVNPVSSPGARVGIYPYYRPSKRGLGMEYDEHPTPGNYHIKGTGVILRAKPEYESTAIATLQNGENVYVFGDVETDPKWMVKQDETVAPNNDPNFAGIDYVRVGTQTHGAGWVAQLYVEPGAGTQIKQPQPQPSPSPTPMTPPQGMSTTSKVLLGTAIAATIGGGGFLVWKALKESRPRHLAPA